MTEGYWCFVKEGSPQPEPPGWYDRAVNHLFSESFNLKERKKKKGEKCVEVFLSFRFSDEEMMLCYIVRRIQGSSFGWSLHHRQQSFWQKQTWGLYLIRRQSEQQGGAVLLTATRLEQTKGQCGEKRRSEKKTKKVCVEGRNQRTLIDTLPGFRGNTVLQKPWITVSVCLVFIYL